MKSLNSLLPKLYIPPMIGKSELEPSMNTPKNPLLMPFLKLAPQDQKIIANELLNNLEDLIISGRSDEITELRQKMKTEYEMATGTFQLYLEEIYNVQSQTLIDPNGNDYDKLKCFLTAIPVTFFPDHDIEEDVWIESFLGKNNTEWAQEFIAAMISAGYLHGEDFHYAMPALFDIHQLFKTPDDSFKIISDVISGDLTLKHPPKPFRLTKDDYSVTRYFVFVSGTRDMQRRTSIIPSVYDGFTQYNEMQQTLESILNHYFCEHAYEQDKDFDALEFGMIVGVPTDGASGVRTKGPSDMMGSIAYHAIKAIEQIDKRSLKVIVEKNIALRSFSVSIYSGNTCISTFKYPHLKLAEGFEIAMLSYVLDTSGLSHYRIIESDLDETPKEKIKKPLLSIVN
jgi:hypothetical protein